MRKCEGNCNGDYTQCEKPATKVNVIGWGEYFYCDEAIKEDVRRGLLIEILTQE